MEIKEGFHGQSKMFSIWQRFLVVPNTGKKIKGKGFSYFPVFCSIENLGQIEKIFGWPRKTPIWVKCFYFIIFIIIYFSFP